MEKGSVINRQCSTNWWADLLKHCESCWWFFHPFFSPFFVAFLTLPKWSVLFGLIILNNSLMPIKHPSYQPLTIHELDHKDHKDFNCSCMARPSWSIYTASAQFNATRPLVAPTPALPVKTAWAQKTSMRYHSKSIDTHPQLSQSSMHHHSGRSSGVSRGGSSMCDGQFVELHCVYMCTMV